MTRLGPACKALMAVLRRMPEHAVLERKQVNGALRYLIRRCLMKTSTLKVLAFQRTTWSLCNLELLMTSFIVLVASFISALRGDPRSTSDETAHLQICTLRIVLHSFLQMSFEAARVSDCLFITGNSLICRLISCSWNQPGQQEKRGWAWRSSHASERNPHHFSLPCFSLIPATTCFTASLMTLTDWHILPPAPPLNTICNMTILSLKRCVCRAYRVNG